MNSNDYINILLNTITDFKKKGFINRFVDVESYIKNDENLTLELFDFKDDAISGAIQRRNNGFVIRINRSHSANRQRFTMAHELAHYLLHRDEIGDGIQDDMLYRSSKADKLEFEANRFASSLLMPKFLIEEAIDEIKKDSGVYNDNDSYYLEEVADRLKVSNQALAYKLDIPFLDK